MLTEEEVKDIKEQLVIQIEKNFPKDKIEAAREEIDSMNNEELESFLKKNNLTKSGDGKCIFCSIISGESPSYLIGENEKAIAVLEINPISEGHVLIVPKEHDLDLKNKEVKKLERNILKKIKEKFKPKKILTASSELFGHKILNIFPVYTDESIKSKRIKISKEKLEEIQKKFKEEKPKKTKPKPKTEKIKEDAKIWLPRRIP